MHFKFFFVIILIVLGDSVLPELDNELLENYYLMSFDGLFSISVFCFLHN